MTETWGSDAVRSCPAAKFVSRGSECGESSVSGGVRDRHH
jgi:hypothetical protein